MPWSNWVPVLTCSRRVCPMATRNYLRMTAITLLISRPSRAVAFTLMTFGPGTKAISVEKIPSKGSTGIPTPLTCSTDSGFVRPISLTLESKTRLWSAGSVTSSVNCWGGSANEITVNSVSSWFPWESVALTRIKFLPGTKKASAWNPPSSSIFTILSFIVTVAPRLVRPTTTTALLGTSLLSTGCHTRRSSGFCGSAVDGGVGVGFGAGVGVGVAVGSGVGGGRAVGVGGVVAVGVGEGDEVGWGVGVCLGVGVGKVVAVGTMVGVGSEVGVGAPRSAMAATDPGRSVSWKQPASINMIPADPIAVKARTLFTWFPAHLELSAHPPTRLAPFWLIIPFRIWGYPPRSDATACIELGSFTIRA